MSRNFSIYQCIDRLLKPLELGFNNKQQAEARAEELTRHHKQPHIVVDEDSKIQISRFEVETIEITASPKANRGVCLMDAIAASRRAEKEELAKKRDHDRERKRAIWKMKSAVRVRQLCEAHLANLEAETCSTGFRSCQYKKARKALRDNFFVDKTDAPCDDTASKKANPTKPIT